MPLQNRVHPDGSLHAVPDRGTMMGNRGGQIHDPATQALHATRRWASKRWICCLVAFKSRRRRVFFRGYSELFFLDEATALTAGHRPCFECRRAAATRFQEAMFASHGRACGWSQPPKADAMDALLHHARTQQEPTLGKPEDQPIGTFFMHEKVVMAKTDLGYQAWRFSGYDRPKVTDDQRLAPLLTPAPMREVLRAGYKPLWHASAQR